MKADWSSSAAACPSRPSGGEHLVPVVADPAAGPAVPAAAGQAHRVRVGRPEERLSCGGAPVEQQPAAGPVGEAEPPDVHGLGVVRVDDVPEAQVQTEAAQGPQASAQPVDLRVPVHRLLAYAAGRLELGLEAFGQVGDRLLEALRDGREVLLVGGDQRRVGLGGEPLGKVKRAGSRGTHLISSEAPTMVTSASIICLCPRRLSSRTASPARRPRATHTPTATTASRDPRFRRFWPRPAILRHDPGLAASPPVSYMLKVGGSGYFFRPRSPVPPVAAVTGSMIAFQSSGMNFASNILSSGRGKGDAIWRAAGE